MNTILLAELRAIMAALEAMPRVPAPAPVLPVKVDIPEDMLPGKEYPYTEEEFATWLEYEWKWTEEQQGSDCSPEAPLYKYYMENRLYPKLLEAGYHYISRLQTKDDEATRLLLNDQPLGLWLIYNIIENVPGPEDICADYLPDPVIAEATENWVYGFVETLFNYDLLNARHIAFDYGERLRLYACTQEGWSITQLGQTVRYLPDVEVAAFLLVLETMRAMLDQDDWFVSRERLQWLFDESPLRFDIYAPDEETPPAEELKRDDGWLRRLRWLGIVVYAHNYTPWCSDIIDFNSRTIELTPSGRAVTEAILAGWNHESGKPSILSLVDNVQSLGLALSSQTAVFFEELSGLREMIGGLHILVRAFGEVQRSFEQKLSKIEDATQQAQAYQEVYEDLHQLVEMSRPQRDDRFREHERQLVKQLGRTWYQLGVESQRFLSTAEYFHSEHKGMKSLDFGPEAVEYCKVVETELIRRLSQPLMLYLHEEVGPKVQLRFGARIESIRTGATARPPALGRLAHLLETSRKSKHNQVVRDFLASRYSEEIQNFVLQDLPSKLKEITTKYRNGSAHSEPLSQKAVEDFRAMLLGSKDSSEPSLLQQVVLIQPATH